MPELSALRYLQAFRCIAERCEDTCCAGMRIPVDAEDLGRLARALPGSSPESLQDGGILRTGATGGCALLTPPGLCSVQLGAGEPALPSACAFFPRVLTEVEGALELSGSLACPELTRLLLQLPDALEPTTLDAGALPRHRSLQRLSSARPRAALQDLWRGPEPVPLRLAAMAALARRVALDAVPAETSPSLLCFDRDEAIRAGAELLAQLALPPGGARTFALSLLRAARPGIRSPRFQRWARDVLEAYEIPAAADAPLPAPARLDERFREGAAARAGRPLEAVLNRYGEHALWRTPWSDSPHLGRFVLGFGAELGVLSCWMTAPGASASDASDVDALQLFTKHLARSELFTGLLDAWATEDADAVLVRTLLLT